MMYNKTYPVTYYMYPLLECEFSKCPDKNKFLEMLESKKNKTTENLLYIQIPFCPDLCSFCPFQTRAVKDESILAPYTIAVIKEMKMLALLPYISEMSFDAVYFGGGSPSILSHQMLTTIFESIFSLFDISPGAEISFEGEPRTLNDPAKLDLLKNFNVSRISFGLQTYNEKLRKQLRIRASLDDVEQVKKHSMNRGFKDVNVDMMYDLPGQTVHDLEYDLDHLKRDDFDSVDYFNLHYYDITKKMKSDMEKGLVPQKPSDQMHLSLANQIIMRMKDLGYHHVADQIFSKSPRLNEFYRLLWGGGDGEYSAETIAIGASARGYINGFSYMNCNNPINYIKKIEQGKYPFELISGLLEQDKNRGAAFFPKFFKISKENSSAIQTIPKSILNYWINNGLIFEIDGEWRLSELGKLWTTNIMADACEKHQRKLKRLHWGPYESMEDLSAMTRQSIPES